MQSNGTSYYKGPMPTTASKGHIHTKPANTEEASFSPSSALLFALRICFHTHHGAFLKITSKCQLYIVMWKEKQRSAEVMTNVTVKS